MTGLAVTAAVAAPFALQNAAMAATETRVFTWGADESRPNVPSTITVNGETLYLTDTTTPKQAGSSHTLTQYFEHAVDSTCGPNDKDRLQQTVPKTYKFSQNGFSGNLQRMRIDYTPIYNNVEREISFTRDINDLITTDGSGVPEYAYDNDGNRCKLADVEYEVASENSSGTIYVAHATYKGSVTEKKLDHYNVVTVYGGNLTKVSGGGDWSMTATYESRETDDGDDGSDNDQDLEENQSAGVTGTFKDVEGFESNNPFGGDDDENANAEMNGNGSDSENENAGANGGFGDNANEPNNETPSVPEQPDENEQQPQQDGGLPIYVPILGGAAVLVLVAGIVTGVILVKNRKKGGSAATGVSGAAVAGGAAQTGYMASAGDVTAGAAGMPVGYIPVRTVESQLHMFIDDGTDDNQRMIAQCEATISPRDDIPTLVEIPSKPDGFDPVARDVEGNVIYVTDEHGNPIQSVDEDGTPLFDDDGMPLYVPVVPEYYLLLDNVDSAASDEMIVYANDYLIYRGPVSEQTLLDTQILTDVLNNDVMDGETENVADEIESYDEKIDEIEDENDRLVSESESADETPMFGSFDDDDDEFADDFGDGNDDGFADITDSFDADDVDGFADINDDETYDDGSFDDFDDDGTVSHEPAAQPQPMPAPAAPQRSDDGFAFDFGDDDDDEFADIDVESEQRSNSNAPRTINIPQRRHR